ncbi:MAG: transposase [Methylocella sp.]
MCNGPARRKSYALSRRRWIKGKESVEIAYFVTSLTREQASPEPLLALAREHWAIETKLHYVRDVSLSEDRCRVRAGARALACIRNLVLAIIRRAGLSVPEARDNFREDRQAAISAVTGRVL